MHEHLGCCLQRNKKLEMAADPVYLHEYSCVLLSDVGVSVDEMKKPHRTDREIISNYVPEPAADMVLLWIEQYDFRLRIKKKRNTKLGDYRHPFKGKGHFITINHDLNRYAFLITLVHEIAHLTNWNKHKNIVKPHGAEWKKDFRDLMRPILAQNIFPDDVHHAIDRYMENPAASSCSDQHLMRVIKRYDEKNNFVLLESLPIRATFRIQNGQTFIKGEKQRTRYKCTEAITNKAYLVSALMEVELVEQTSS